MGVGHSDGTIARRVRHVEALLEDRGVVTGEELDGLLDRFLTRARPANGFRIVARAWVDDGFRARLLHDANHAITELGLRFAGSAGEAQQLRVVENTAAVHNVIVCTLCSCYPLSLLGPSPSWYKSPAYRARVVRQPREVLAEFGLRLPAGVQLRVWDASAENRYMVLPRRPPGSEGLSEEQLAGLVTRNGLIGTAAV